MSQSRHIKYRASSLNTWQVHPNEDFFSTYRAGWLSRSSVRSTSLPRTCHGTSDVDAWGCLGGEKKSVWCNAWRCDQGSLCQTEQTWRQDLWIMVVAGWRNCLLKIRKVHLPFVHPFPSKLANLNPLTNSILKNYFFAPFLQPNPTDFFFSFCLNFPSVLLLPYTLLPTSTSFLPHWIYLTVPSHPPNINSFGPCHVEEIVFILVWWTNIEQHEDTYIAVWGCQYEQYEENIHRSMRTHLHQYEETSCMSMRTHHSI